MRRSLVRGELVKVRSARTLWALPAGAVAYAVVSFGPALTAPAAERADLGGDTLLAVLRGPGFVVGVAMLLLGILVTAGEVRHRTLPGLLVVAPRRESVAAAKAAAVAGVGVVTAVATEAVALALGAWFLAANGVESTAAVSSLALTVAAVAAVAVSYGLVGVGLGLAVRDQSAAVGLALVWIGIVEGAVPIVLRAPWLFKWLPSGAANSLLGVAAPPPDLLPAWAGGLLLAGVAGAVLAAGASVLGARDPA